ncbi:endonuclease domain-containing protein [Micromonospora mirobrigensis]|uniref:Transcriptional regulator, AbiEi antitoxin, Type IV TA system n=1 Tax=Micromonospora mirobrigensis TaxID=262898 RepID=A0A1C5A0L6_9ACTN|nr:endonuclease domain-containing protein [Micromonospora mirobrigensis]SCF38725.1 Transcriptional regulator, AbiEi antitoxin, Type IV TA system [Micromonospora mirobrigensis]
MVRTLPAEEADTLEWLTFEQAGVVTTSQAGRLLTPGTIRGLVRSGRWRSVCRGVLLTGNGRLTRDQQLWVAVLAAGPQAVLAGVTAAAEAGVRGLRREPLHVLVPADRRAGRALRGLPVDMPAVVVHRTSVLPATHLQRARPTRTVTARAVVDAAGWARGVEEAQLVLTAACQQRRVLPDEIAAMVAQLPRARRQELIRRTIADIAGGAQALSELHFVRLCRRHRLPAPDLQERRTDRSGRTRWLDAYWREWGLHVEVDGAHHMDVRQWADDMRRQNDVWTSGDRILRFPAWLVRARPDEVATTVRHALLAAGWRPRT